MEHIKSFETSEKKIHLGYIKLNKNIIRYYEVCKTFRKLAE